MSPEQRSYNTNKQFINITKEKWQSIDFSQFKCVKKYHLTHHDIPFLFGIKFSYKERTDVYSGLY